MDYARDFLDGLLSDAPEGTEASGLEEQCNDISRRHDDLSSKINDELSQMEAASENVERFSSNLRRLTSEMSDLDEEFDHKGAAGRDADTLEAQIEDMAGFMSGRLQEMEGALDDLRRECEDLIENGFISEQDSYKQQVKV